ncbi:MAG: shikimate kinase [Clostridia bacterium]|nr:shikimate kinase [Clostridia bacterium]
MNITLIGMPGSGKSTVGQALAKRLGLQFVDVDQVIIRKTGQTLAEILDDVGDAGFRQVEERINAELDVQDSVIAPGGSVIYGPRAMAHLRDISTVVYLQVEHDELLRRLGDLHARGVSILPGQTFRDLYNERCPYYERYAHLIVDTKGLSLTQVAEKIAEQVQG